MNQRCNECEAIGMNQRCNGCEVVGNIEVDGDIGTLKCDVDGNRALVVCRPDVPTLLQCQILGGNS